MDDTRGYTTSVSAGAMGTKVAEERHTASTATLEDMKHDPDEYQTAKKRLRRAVLECYRYLGYSMTFDDNSLIYFLRGLELLNNYRVRTVYF